MLGDHYHWRKTYAYEGSTKIPYIVKWPLSLSKQIRTGTRVDQPVEMRQEMVRHLSERGDGFVKDGQLVKREQTLLYSPHYPKSGS